jgi:hypothetical protein
MIALSRRSPILWIAVAAGLAVAWYLISPYFIRSTLVEPPVPVAGAPLKSGQFNEIDVVHKGTGTASLFRLPDGRLRVQLSDFSVTNGPDLHVFLSRHADPSGDAQAKDGLLLGALKAPEGAFAYETEAPVDPGDVKAVVIHCVRFRTLFSYATLA